MSGPAGPAPAEGLRTLALSLLVGAPYSTDGVPAGLVCASWPAPATH
ncbi:MULTISPECIES: hypothetical protein [Oerskovia]|uniref:Uncharacterized protein n=2 Tax=Oerskovia TaxID=162491 RepID=A0ABR8V6X2_9CELL|nr:MULTISPECIES: hypothetical protein [Oerskovia]MBD8000066.1 hypothetical protein [Oerskovia gallyi]MBM7496142.1 hypothetical protein [Oerskovia paurometabola]